MKKELHIYDLHDPQQYEDERSYWKSKTPAEKLHTLEVIRKAGYKLFNNHKNMSDGSQHRLRRVLRVIEYP